MNACLCRYIKCGLLSCLGLYVLRTPVHSPYSKPLSAAAWTTTTLFWPALPRLLGRPFRVHLIKPVSNVRPYIRTSVRPSTESFFDFSEIWHVGRGRWIMHDVWPDPRWTSRALESWKSGHFQKLSSPPFTKGAGNWPLIPKLGHNI